MHLSSRLILLAIAVAGTTGPAKASPHSAAENNVLTNMLDEFVDVQGFDQPMSLKEALQELTQRFGKKGKDLPIVVDVSAFNEENPEGANIYDTQVLFPPFPKKLRAASLLELMLGKADPPNATYLIRDGLLVITTKDVASPRRLLQRTVSARFHHTPLAEAIEELSAITGASIVLDNRVGDKLKTPVSASFRNDVSLESALQMLADMAGLKMVALTAGIYITEPANAERMQTEIGRALDRLGGLAPRDGDKGPRTQREKAAKRDK